jgi:hypothetical protein
MDDLIYLWLELYPAANGLAGGRGRGVLETSNEAVKILFSHNTRSLGGLGRRCSGCRAAFESRIVARLLSYLIQGMIARSILAQSFRGRNIANRLKHDTIRASKVSYAMRENEAP